MSTLIAHYTKLETAAHYILPREALRISMGSFLNFDDPKETKGWHFKTSEKMTVDQQQLFHERRISDEIKKHFGACFKSCHFRLTDLWGRCRAKILVRKGLRPVSTVGKLSTKY